MRKSLRRTESSGEASGLNQLVNSPFPSCSLSKRGLVPNHSYENEFNLHVNELSFSYEKMGTKTRFEEEAKGNSEMAYSVVCIRTLF